MPAERRRARGLHPALLVSPHVRRPRAQARRARADGVRGGRLPLRGVGEWPPRRRARGRVHAVRVRRDRRADRRRAADGLPARRGRPARPRPAARQAGVGAEGARHLVPAHDRPLADGVARGRARRPRGGPDLDARHRRVAGEPGGAVRRRRAGARRRGVAAGDALAEGRAAGAADRVAADRLAPRRRAAGVGGGRRGVAGDRPARPRPRRGPVGGRLDARRAAPDRRRRRAARRGRRGRRPRRELHGDARRRHRGRPLHAQRPADRAAARARPGLLARRRDDAARRRRAAPRRRAAQVAGLQRRPQAPEGRVRALPLLGRHARADGVGGTAQRLQDRPGRPRSPRPRVDGGGAARPVAPLHRRVGAGQRVVGLPRPDRLRPPSATACGRCGSSPRRSTRPARS